MTDKIYFLIYDNDGNGFYKAPGDGYTDEIDEAHRYETFEFDFSYAEPGPNAIYDAHIRCLAAGRINKLELDQLMVAPESLQPLQHMVAQHDRLAELIKAGEAALRGQESLHFDKWLGVVEPEEKKEEEEKPPPNESTELESGQLLSHHPWEVCQLPCPLHGASRHPLFAADRGWSQEKKVMQRRCVHEYWHPDPDDIKIREVPHLIVHSCCPYKCCKENQS